MRRFGVIFGNHSTYAQKFKRIELSYERELRLETICDDTQLSELL